MKCVFIYYLEDLAETFLIKKELSDELYIHRGPHVKYPLFSSDFNETCFSRQNFEKNIQIQNFMKISKKSNMKFHENPSGGIQVVSCEREGTKTSARTDDGRKAGKVDRQRYNEINSHFSQFCEHA